MSSTAQKLSKISSSELKSFKISESNTDKGKVMGYLTYF